MLYLITEDSNSGRQFWNKVFEIFLGKNNYILVDFDKSTDGVNITGNTSLISQVDKVLNKAQPRDDIFIAFDNIGTSVRVNTKTGHKLGFDSGDFIINTNQKCILHKVNLYATTYYCFEEVYLSYDGLIDICNKDGNDSKIISALYYVKQHILNGTEYYNRNNVNVQNIINMKIDAAKNKEHFADALLYQATRSIQHGLFLISKNNKQNNLLKCWIEDCVVLKAKNKILNNNFCNKCKFCMKNHNTIEKLIDLENGSVKKFVSLVKNGSFLVRIKI